MLRVLKDKSDYFSVYNGCTIQINYDPSKLTLKSIGPSSAVTGIYGNTQRVDDTKNVSSGTYDNLQATDGTDDIQYQSCTVRYTIICADKDINLFNKDLIEIVFTPVNGYEKYTTGSSNINIELIDVSNLSGTAYSRTGFSKTETVSDTLDYPSTSVNAQFTYKKVKKGDVNQNGTIDLVDVTEALRHFNKAITLSETEERAGDVNNDGNLTLNDVIMILKYVNSGVDEPSRTFPAGWVED
jgi:hypothetical protein